VTFGIVVAAAGRGTRMGQGGPKAFLRLAGVPLVVHALRPFLRFPGVARIAVVIPDPAAVAGLPGFDDPRVVAVRGGEERQDSVASGIEALGDVDLILVHDAARPLVEAETIRAVAEAAAVHGAAVPIVPLPDTVKELDGQGFVLRTLEREGLGLAQTPQGFRADLLRRAHARAAADRFYGTDEASLVERLGEKVAAVPGSARNFKITVASDLSRAEDLLGKGGEPSDA
jgi:2-C-methyl-D-erythritol 4-phosphate cytidylyltransferase